MTFRPVVAALALSCLFALRASPAAANSDRGDLGDRDDLLQFLNSEHPSPGTILAGSCLMAVNYRSDPPTWIYVILPNSKTKGYLAQLVPDEPYPPAWMNMGNLHVLKRSVSLSDNFGGEATLAILEGSGWWIVQRHLAKVSTYAQALAKPPTLHCPTGSTMTRWRYGRRQRLSR